RTGIAQADIAARKFLCLYRRCILYIIVSLVDRWHEAASRTMTALVHSRRIEAQEAGSAVPSAPETGRRGRPTRLRAKRCRRTCRKKILIWMSLEVGDRFEQSGAMTYSRYGPLAIERAKPAPTDSQLAAIETLLGARLPASFRDFLRVANGGSLAYVVDVPMGSGNMGSGKIEQLCFSGIFSADEGTFCDETFVGEIRSAREYVKIPQGVLPFARDGGGSVVYLDLSGEGNGRVVAFVMGLPEWTGRRTESAFIELASSFDEYVAKLRIDRADVMDTL